MTVQELYEDLEILMNLGEWKKEVVMTADYGDMGHTTQALPVKRAAPAVSTNGAYSRSGRIILQENDDDRNALNRPRNKRYDQEVIALF